MLCGVYDTDSLAKEFGSKEFVTIIEVINARRCCGKTNKLRYIIYIQHKRDADQQYQNHHFYHIFL